MTESLKSALEHGVTSVYVSFKTNRHGESGTYDIESVGRKYARLKEFPKYRIDLNTAIIEYDDSTKWDVGRVYVNVEAYEKHLKALQSAEYIRSGLYMGLLIEDEVIKLADFLKQKVGKRIQ